MLWYQPNADAWFLGGVFLIIALFVIVWLLFLGDTPNDLDDWDDDRIFDDDTDDGSRACVGGDPRCPCQDGDSCHYVATKETKAWPRP